jgi:hypothetical protein
LFYYIYKIEQAFREFILFLSHFIFSWGKQRFLFEFLILLLYIVSSVGFVFFFFIPLVDFNSNDCLKLNKFYDNKFIQSFFSWSYLF